MARSGFTFEKDSYHMRRYNRRRAFAHEHLGGACSLCGSKKSLFFSSRIEGQRCPVNWNVGDEKFHKTLEGTILLCGDCYGRRISRAKGGFRHGTHYSARKLKCQCEICEQKRDALRKASREHDAANPRRRVPSGRVERAFNPTA